MQYKYTCNIHVCMQYKYYVSIWYFKIGIWAFILYYTLGILSSVA